MRYHHQNLSYDKLPLWRHGRAWWRSFTWEWCVFYRSMLGVSVNRRGFSIRALWFALYVSGRHDTEGAPEWGVRWNDGAVWLEHPWVRQMEWRSADPWYKKVICLHVVDWLIGRAKHSSTKGKPYEVIIPMPEGSYKATATPETAVWRRRFYWPSKRRDDVWIEIPGGIPFSGRGRTQAAVGSRRQSVGGLRSRREVRDADPPKSHREQP